ncbi:MAG: hypothetical protein ACMZ7B_09815 [Balneola sp.]
MNLQEAKETYSEIRELYSAIEKLQIGFRVLPVSKELEEASFRKILIRFGSTDFSIPVDDEYKDADLNNPALLLQLVIYAIEEYEDCDDFLVWSTAYGLNTSSPIHLNWYRKLGEVAPKIREIIGTGISGISDFDWQLSAGAAQALRELNR